MPDTPAPTALHSTHSMAMAAGLGGTPLAILSVMLWETYTGTPLDDIRATAVGSIGAGLFAYIWHVITSLIDRLILKP